MPPEIILSKQSIFPSASKKASILIIALWSVCLLSTFAVILAYSVRQKLTLANRLEQRDKLHFISHAGMKQAFLELKKEAVKDYDAFGDAWSNNPAAFKDLAILDGRMSISYNYFNEATRKVEVRYGLMDEESKVNINKAEAGVLERLSRLVLGIDEAQAQELAASIVDWRDSDSELSLPLGSAEDSYYGGLPSSYEAKDADFEVLSELLLVKEMTPEYLKYLKNYFTVYGSGKVNINTASGVVLLALGLEKETVDKIISFRSGQDKIFGTSDDNIFSGTADIVSTLSQGIGLSESETAKLSAAAEKYLTVSSSIFSASGVSKLSGRNYLSDSHCVFNRSGKIFYWQES
jgi:general secretion pathway protein K